MGDDGPGRVPVLDGLRAISIGLVLASHSLIYDPHGPGVIRFGLSCGNAGVSLFFVISGYIITRLLLREEAATGRIHFGRFYARRALRLLPACYVYVLTVYLLATCGAIPPAPIHDYLASVLYVRNLVGRGHETAHLWSLSLEEQFYLVWPAALVLVPARRRYSATAGLIAAVWFWRFGLVLADRVGDGALHIRTDLRIDTILFGCLLALAGRSVRPAGWLLPAGAVGLVFWPFVSAGVPCGRAFDTGVMAASLTAVLCWFLRHPESTVSRLLGTVPFVAVGRLSYSLYLWQQLFLGPHDVPMRDFRAFPVGLACAVAAAVASYWFVERPFLRMKDRYRPPGGRNV